jgi:hypothetical protein
VTTLEMWMPLVLSGVALSVWVVAGAGLIEHWRRRWNVPIRALMAGVVAAVSATVTYTVTSGAYIDMGLGPVARQVATFERAILAATGIVALSSLVRSAWRQGR